MLSQRQRDSGFSLQAEVDRGVFAQTLAELTSFTGRVADSGTWEMTSQMSEVYPEHHQCVSNFQWPHPASHCLLSGPQASFLHLSYHQDL